MSFIMASSPKTTRTQQITALQIKIANEEHKQIAKYSLHLA